jgi:hypothetical protein
MRGMRFQSNVDTIYLFYKNFEIFILNFNKISPMMTLKKSKHVAGCNVRFKYEQRVVFGV